MIRKGYIFILLAASAMSSCSDWNDHYEDVQGAGSGQTIMQMLESDSQTTTFAKLVREAGYGDMLSSSQSFTVFAPTNDALSGFSSEDRTELERMVTNHIARYTYPSSTPAENGVRMIDGKIYYFDNSGSFAGSSISASNGRADNGLIHKIQARIPYVLNLYEYIRSNANTSELYEFIKKFDNTVIDTENSVEIGIDDAGRPVYDTVWVEYNRLLDDEVYGLGSIATEDSAYTMLIPDNAAWQQAYDRIAPSFVNYNTDEKKADSIKDIRTRLAIFSDLIYREAPADPAAADTLVSTSGSVIHSPEHLFGAATLQKVSNGSAYVVSLLNYDNTETWNKEIVVEGETQNGREYNNSTTVLYTRNVTEESKITGVSGDRYIEVSPMSQTNPSVTIDIPNVLAGTYNVYAEFLPPTVEGEVDSPDSTYISFIISYGDNKGKTSQKSNKKKGEANLTSGTEKVKMLAFENLTFPVSDYTDRLWLMDEDNDESTVTTVTKLNISTNVTNSELSSKKFGRTFRLDRIILEPIKQ